MKFIRRNGRVIPIKDGKQGPKNERHITHDDGKGNSITVGYKTKKTTIASRFKEGAKLGGAMGAMIGIPGAIETSKSLKTTGAIIAGAAAAGAAGLGLLNAALGRRKVDVVTSMEVKGKKFGKLKKTNKSSV